MANVSESTFRVALPPGPWAYRPERYDDWGTVRDAEGHPVANTCPPGLAQDFKDERRNQPPSVTLWKAGPPQARAVAELLIRAEREADPTPVDEAIADSLGWTRFESDKLTTWDAPMGHLRVLHFTSSDRPANWVFYVGLKHFVAPTVGQVRTAARLFGIELK
jgi:hypothetical protein